MPRRRPPSPLRPSGSAANHGAVDTRRTAPATRPLGGGRAYDARTAPNSIPPLGRHLVPTPTGPSRTRATAPAARGRGAARPLRDRRCPLDGWQPGQRGSCDAHRDRAPSGGRARARNAPPGPGATTPAQPTADRRGDQPTDKQRTVAHLRLAVRMGPGLSVRRCGLAPAARDAPTGNAGPCTSSPRGADPACAARPGDPLGATRPSRIRRVVHWAAARHTAPAGWARP